MVPLTAMLAFPSRECFPVVPGFPSQPDSPCRFKGSLPDSKM
ncbi:hypothetical protein PR003_g14312 [Phytophthora rubi]|uniref:Uncharacterized protein n=1 Tax=Phytophthora rubi TaxID=129364 RepID=A0A6A3LN97_9STRA|nr:hypothetical protein PR002_g13808 [Phytophthora rubi]KAE9021001.1 hypothetical protein PR001_g13466 [Phytophthora rubi]KAE9332857.1 hypothetical protein PR003_g14312 [Phytophthora rubi]